MKGRDGTGLGMELRHEMEQFAVLVFRVDRVRLLHFRNWPRLASRCGISPVEGVVADGEDGLVPVMLVGFQLDAIEHQGT